MILYHETDIESALAISESGTFIAFRDPKNPTDESDFGINCEPNYTHPKYGGQALRHGAMLVMAWDGDVINTPPNNLGALLDNAVNCAEGWRYLVKAPIDPHRLRVVNIMYGIEGKLGYIAKMDELAERPPITNPFLRKMHYLKESFKLKRRVRHIQRKKPFITQILHGNQA